MNRSTRIRASLGALAVLFGLGTARAEHSLTEIAPFLKQHCYDCHGSEKQKGDYRFDTLGTDLTKVGTLETWQNILDQLNLGEMPPPKRPQPKPEEVAPVVETVTAALAEIYAKGRSTGARTVLRRLNRHELRNTLRDLLYLNGVEYSPDAAGSRLVDNNGNGSVERTGNDPLRFFPEDEEEDGFFNIGDKLVMSDFLLKLTLGAVEETLTQATHLQPRPQLETQRFAAHLSKARGRHLEIFAREIHPQFDALYSNRPLRPDALGRGMPTSAEYRLTVEVSGHNQKHPWGEMLPTAQGDPHLLSLALRKGRDTIPVAQWQVPGDGKTHSFKVEAWIDQQWIPELTWENGPTERELRADLLVQKFRPDQFRKAPNRKEITDKKKYEERTNAWWQDMAHALLKDYRGPSLRIHSLTIEPLIEQWPPRSHTALYGSGSVKEAEIRELLTTFAGRAFRRPVTKEEVEPFVQLVLQERLEPVVTLPGGIENLSYRVYEGKWDKLPDFDTLNPIAEGTLPSGFLDINAAKRKEFYGLVFEGTLKAPKAGEYLFEMASDDGARMLVDGKKVIEHDGLHGANLKKGKVQLAPGEHALRVEYLAYGSPNSFRAGWSGPGAVHTKLSIESLHNGSPQKKPTEELPRYIRAMQNGYAAILCSPQFLYLKETGDKLDQFALASRLSYFLWSSMPDQALTDLARAGKLANPAVLDEQVERMLRDPRAAAFVRHFTTAWLRLDKLGKMPPEGGDYQFYKNLRVEPMLLEQATTYFQDILQSNGKIARFIDSDYTYMNQVLGKWIYRREDIRGTQLRKIKLDDPRRGGIFTLPGVMTATANGVDTSPVIRGTWVLENVLGTPPAPPPPDVEPLPTDTREANTIRELLALHRKNEACNSCHRKIDPMGFAFENFDVVGRWRDKYKRVRDPIDATAVLPNGREIKDIVEFKKLLMERKPLVIRCLTEKMLTYATGRHLEALDRGEVNRIIQDLAKDGDHLRDLVHLVVQSRIFLRK